MPATLPTAGFSTMQSAPKAHDFDFEGTFLDAAFTHPFSAVARAASVRHANDRAQNAGRFWPVDNPRDGAVAAFANLIGADSQDVAVVPSTMEGENLVATSLGIGPDAGVVTDGLHYDASLVLYGELRRRGVPVAIVRPRNFRIDLEDIAASITPATRLIAVSLVSSTTGFQHDLKAICELAHSRGVLVYADVIQAVGAMPFDVNASGVDFCCAGTYKWLMGDFGSAFLYVRRDRLDRLRRSQVGWRQLRRWPEEHVLPYDSPGPVLDTYEFRHGAAGVFECSSPAYGALAIAQSSIRDVLRRDPAVIAERRQPLIDRLQEELPTLGLLPLTPGASSSPIVAFALRNADQRLRARLADARIKVSLYPNRVRISPSVYNTLDDVERFIDVVRVALAPTRTVIKGS